MLINILQPDFTFTDERGSLCQITSGGYTQINSVFTKKGAVRGRGHRHEKCTEAFYIISGSVLVTATKNGETESRLFGSGDMFSVAPGTGHSFEYKEDSYLVVMYDKPVINPDGTKDIIEYE